MVEDPFDFPYRRGGFKEWAPRLLREMHELDSVYIQDDICYSVPAPDLTGASVLVIGGGGSSNQVSTEGYDYIISMNHFFLNERFSKTKIDLVGLGAGVNLKSVDFLKYVYEFNPTLAFEIHPNWSPASYSHLANSFRVYYHTQIYGRIGMAVRLINLAAALGASTVSFIGLDGPEAILAGNHAFQPGKKDLPSLLNEGNASIIHQAQYDHFWGYIQNLYPNTKFVSIDKENKYHKCLHC